MPPLIEAHKMGVGKIADEPLAGVVFFDVNNQPIARLKLNAEGCKEIAKHLAYAAHDIEANEKPGPPPPGGWDPAAIEITDIEVMVLRDIAARGMRAYSTVSDTYHGVVHSLAGMRPALVSVEGDVISATEMGRQVLKAQA